MRRVNHLDSNVMSYGVLIRLSAQKLHWLKMACNEWKGLITDRSFIKSHLKNKEPLSGFFFQERYLLCDEDVERISYISLEPVGIHTSVFDFLPEKVVLLASCNGLVCCRSIIPSQNPKLYVCNPLIKEWKSLEWKACERSTNAALVFDPTHPFVGSTTNYQVVVVSKAKGAAGKPQFGFDIYSSLTGEWKRSRERCERKHDIFKNKGIYVDGVLYWLTDGDQILMFDPNNEISMLIRMPIPFADLDYSGEMCLGESGGKLCYVLLSNKRLMVWTLVDPYESLWDPSISVENLKECGFNFMLTENLRLFSDRGDGGVDLLSFKDGVLALRYLDERSEIYSFELETRTKKKLCSVNQLGSNALIGPIVLPYAMSLAPL